MGRARAPPGGQRRGGSDAVAADRERVTGIRDAGTAFPLPTATAWLREIVAGRRLGPVRQLLSGQSLADAQEWGANCERGELVHQYQTCVYDSADAIHVIDSLKAAGATAIKMRSINTRPLYYTIARAARRIGLPFGGHVQHGMPVKAQDAADSGATFLEHMNAASNIGFTPTWENDCLITPFTRTRTRIPNWHGTPVRPRSGPAGQWRNTSPPKIPGSYRR